MKLAVIGSRGLNVNIKRFLPKNNVDLIISGGAKGIDTLAEKYADENNIPKKIIKPNYEKYGKKAPLIRNKEIIDQADEIIVIWDGKSPGTKFSITYAVSKKKIMEIFVEDYE